MRYQLTDADLAAIKAVDSLLPLYVRLVAERAKQADEREAWSGHIAQAKQQYCDDEINIDSDTIISEGNDPGVWVQAWLWVYHSDVEGFEYEDEDEDEEVES